LKDTIFALSSASGKAGISIVRISGQRSFDVLKEFTGSIPEPRKAVLKKLWFQGLLLDECIVLCFASNASFTGEELVELHLHGSSAVVSKVLSVLGGLDKLRMAEPGEFTRRALYNSRLDLSQVEGLSDLLNAETESQQKQSLTLLTGALGKKVSGWRKKILYALALTEVMIDFSDEDVPENTLPKIKNLVSKLLVELKKELRGYKAAEIVRNGFNVVILGRPNSGKSSLINFLSGRDISIVSDISGTTRDIMEAKLNINGEQVNFFDTAGIQYTNDPIEKIGIKKALKIARNADLRVILLEPDDQPQNYDLPCSEGNLFFRAKCDINKKHPYKGLSSRTGEGIPELIETISELLKSKVSAAGLVVNERHKNSISKTVLLLNAVNENLNANCCEVELLAEDLRVSIQNFDLLIGKIDVEHILENIFSSFCIGK